MACGAGNRRRKNPGHTARPLASTKRLYSDFAKTRQAPLSFINKIIFPGRSSSSDQQSAALCSSDDKGGRNFHPGLCWVPGPGDEFIPTMVVTPEDMVMDVNDVSPFTLIYFHGNAETVGETLSFKFIPALVIETGCTVVVMEYPGYGIAGWMPVATPKTVSTWTLCLFDWLKYDLQLDMSFVVPYGRSIGTGPASLLAALLQKDSEMQTLGSKTIPGPPTPLALALNAPFISIARMVSDFVGSFLSHLGGNGFDNEAMLSHLQGTHLCLTHGKDDEVIGVEHGEALAAGYQGPVMSKFYCNKGHNDFTLCEMVTPVAEMLTLLREKYGIYEKRAEQRRRVAFVQCESGVGEDGDRGISGDFRCPPDRYRVYI